MRLFHGSRLLMFHIPSDLLHNSMMRKFIYNFWQVYHRDYPNVRRHYTTIREILNVLDYRTDIRLETR